MTIVLLPGMEGTGALFESLVSLLEARFSVKVVRYPVTEPLGYAELEEVARAALPNEGPFIILGESFSGPIAISLAKSCSSQLKGIILCCSFARNPYPFLGNFRPLIGVLPVSMVPKAVLNFFLLGKFSTTALRSALSHAIAQVSPTARRARLKAVLMVNVSDKLASLTVPVLYLRASHDRVVSHKASEFISGLNPRTRVVRIEGPHLLLQAAPVAAAKVIGDFVKEIHPNGRL